MSQNKLSFYLLVISQAISLIGGAVLRFAISLHVLDLTGSAEIFATMVAVSFLPLVIFTPLGGAVADRFSKKMLLVVSDSANTLLIALLAVMLFGGSQSILLLGAAITLLTLISTCYHPTVTASLPAILPADELVKANGIVQGIKAISGLAGPILAGFLFGAIGVNSLVGLTAILFLFSALINIFIKIPYSPRKMEGGMFKAIMGDMKEGFVYVAKENTLLLKVALIFAVVVFFFQAMLSVTFPYMIRITFGMSEEFFGLANAAIGASMLIASLVSGKLKKYMEMQNLPYFVAIVGIASVPIAISALIPPSGLMPFLLLTTGFVMSMFVLTLTNILVMTYAQIHVPAHMVGKAIAIVITIANVAVPVGQLAMGLLIENLADTQFALYLSIAALTFLLGLASKKRLAAN